MHCNPTAHSPKLTPSSPPPTAPPRSLLSHVNYVDAPTKKWTTAETLYGQTTAGWLLMMGFTIDAWLLGLCLQRMGYICMTVGIRARAALVQAVTHKAFRLNTVRADQSAAIVK